MEVLELFQCMDCSKSFNAKNRYNQHLKTHSKPYACQSCEKRFALRADLHRHAKGLHRVGQTRFDCDAEGCTFKATRKDNLTQHKILHKNGQKLRQSPKGDAGRNSSLLSFDDRSSPKSKRADLAAPINPSSFMQAASAGSIAFLAHALRAGIDVNTKTDDGFTALHCAARADQVEALRHLLTVGADHNYLSGMHPKSKGTQAIHQAVEGKSLACFEVLLRLEPQTTLTVEANLKSLMVCVARCGNTQFVHLLVKHCISKWSTIEWPAILGLESAKTGQLSIIRLLLHDHQLSLLPAEEQSAHHSPLYQAAKHGHLAVVRLLLAASHTHETNDKRLLNLKLRTLRRAAKKGHAEVVRALLDSDGKGNVLAQSALQHAAANGHLKAVELLVCHTDVNINQVSSGGDTALHLAARAGHLLVVELFLQQKNVDAMRKNKNGETPLFAAFWQCKLDTIRVLSKFDTSPELQGIDFANDSISQMTKRLLDGNMLSVNTWGSRKSVLHLAAGLNDIDLLLRILRHEDFDSEILTATDYDGATPLDIASSKDNVAIMDLLISHGAPDTRTKPDQRSRSGDEPTHNKMSKSYDDSESDDDFEIES